VLVLISTAALELLVQYITLFSWCIGVSSRKYNVITLIALSTNILTVYILSHTDAIGIHKLQFTLESILLEDQQYSPISF